jgi:hypothetical protein
MVTIDGSPIPSALIGVARPISPGRHSFQGMAEGMVSDVVTATIKEGGKETITLTLKIGAPPPIYTAGRRPSSETPSPSISGAPAAVTAPTAQAGPAATSFGADARESSGSNGLRTLSFVAFAVGVVGLGAAGVFALQAGSKHSDADSKFDQFCGSGGSCTATNQNEIRDLDKQANDAKSLANIGLIVGGVGVAAGLTLILLNSGGSERSVSKAARDTPPPATFTPWIGIHSMGLTGTF